MKNGRNRFLLWQKRARRNQFNNPLENKNFSGMSRMAILFLSAVLHIEK